jgi:hypothetical protein
MSRIGKKPITIPKGVTIKVVDGVQGPKLRQIHPAGIDFELDGTLVAKRGTDDPAFDVSASPDPHRQRGDRRDRYFWRELDGAAGYRAEVKGSRPSSLGYSHAVV